MNKAYERFMNIIHHSINNPSQDFEFTSGGKAHKVEAKEIQAFIADKLHNYVKSAYAPVPGTTKAIQAFTGSTDLAKIETSSWNAFQEEDNYDMGWQAAFRPVPLRPGQLEWSIGNVTSGVEMKILEEGQKVEYGSIEGTVARVEVELYGTGLMLSWKTIEGRDLARFYSDMSDFRAARMLGYANAHYGLLAAASLSNPVAWQGVVADTDLVRDIATLNKGYDTIGTNCKDLGFGDTANAKMIIYAAPSLRGRIDAALRSTTNPLIQSGKQATRVYGNITVIYTYNSNIPANKGVMVLPGKKIQNSIYLKGKELKRQDSDTLNWLKSVFDAFGAVVGEVAQTSELSFI